MSCPVEIFVQGQMECCQRLDGEGGPKGWRLLEDLANGNHDDLHVSCTRNNLYCSLDSLIISTDDHENSQSRYMNVSTCSIVLRKLSY